MTGRGKGRTEHPVRFRQWIHLILAAVLLLAGCASSPKPARSPRRTDEPGPQRFLPWLRLGNPSRRDPVTVLDDADTGPILIVFPGCEAGGDPDLYGLVFALRRAIDGIRCRAAVFESSQVDAARNWLRASLEKRRPGSQNQVVLAGYACGGSSAGELAERILSQKNGPTIRLLITVDAVKRNVMSRTAGSTASLMTGGGRALAAYWSPSPVDGDRLLRHINYYQSQSLLLAGDRMSNASENHHVSGLDDGLVTHARLDNLVAGNVLTDMRRSIRGNE